MVTTTSTTGPGMPPIGERQAARQSLLVNLAFKNAIAFNGDTAWEEVTCVGYNPALRQLVAVVSIKQTTGYQGGLCLAGSTDMCASSSIGGRGSPMSAWRASPRTTSPTWRRTRRIQSSTWSNSRSTKRRTGVSATAPSCRRCGRLSPGTRFRP